MIHRCSVVLSSRPPGPTPLLPQYRHESHEKSDTRSIIRYPVVPVKLITKIQQCLRCFSSPGPGSTSAPPSCSTRPSTPRAATFIFDGKWPDCVPACLLMLKYVCEDDDDGLRRLRILYRACERSFAGSKSRNVPLN